MTQATQLTASATLARMIDATRDWTLKSLEGVPAEKHFHCLGEGKATTLWQLGHATYAVDSIGMGIGLGDAPSLPDSWSQAFQPPSFGGREITANAADYPGWDEIAGEYRRVMTTFAEKVGALTDDDLLGPARGAVPEPLKDYISTVQDTVMLMIQHDSHHRGQIAMLAQA